MNPNETFFNLQHADVSSESAIVRARIAQINWSDATRAQVVEHATELVNVVRHSQSPSWMQAMLTQYQLSNPEGLALMSLAEAILRVPDVSTRMALLEDKVSDRNWSAHQSQSDSTLVNTATRGLMLLEQVLDAQRSEGVLGTLKGLIKRVGEPVIDAILAQILKQLGGQFVLGQTMDLALKEARVLEAEGYTYSYDMLGEGAKTHADGQRYWQSYHDAIVNIGAHCVHDDIAQNPGISIKLSALHPRYEVAQTETVLRELTPRVLELAQLAAKFNMGLNIDAEEAERLELSLLIIKQLMASDELGDWRGLGVVVQGYNPRASEVLEHLYALAKQYDRHIMVRLVKGAYWDAEIKRAQVLGLSEFPVHTRKAFTDVAYIANAKRLLGMNDRIYAQFATHNAHTVCAVLRLIADLPTLPRYEFQRLHGMGEALHEVAKRQNFYRCRIYAPVGQHHDLLSYLVRRLLENGANGSFVHQIADERLPASVVVQDPIARAQALLETPSDSPVRPASALYTQRANSQGFDLSNSLTLARFQNERDEFWRNVAVPATSDASMLLSHNPAVKDEIVGAVPLTLAEQIPAMSRVAQEAQTAWQARSVDERADVLNKIAHLYEKNHSVLMALLTREAGKSWSDAVAELREAVDFCYYYSSQTRSLVPNQARGVVVCISPWNFPLAIFTGQVVANLVVGNAVLAKPAELTPLIADYAVRLMHEAGVPTEVLQLAQGKGSEIGQALVAQANIAGVCFTGSLPTAQRIHQTLAQHAAPDALLIAETGGLNAMIVDSTALPEQAVRDIIASGFQSAGQRCSALRLLYVQVDIYDKLIEMLKGAMDALVIGNPADLSTDVSPVIDATAQNKLLAYIEQNRGHIVHQKSVPNEHAQKGYFVPPTLLRVNRMADLGEEQFGPIVHVATFAAGELNRVLDEINASGYGLTLGVHTRIERRAHEIAARAHVGNIYINRNQIGAVVGVQPFGGCGLSGTGPKAGGALYLRELTRSVENAEQLAQSLPWQAQLLDSPTGETNAYRVQARGRVLCLGPTVEDVRAQILTASATHNHAIVPHLLLEQTLYRYPELTQHTHSAIELSDTSVPAYYDFDAVAYFAPSADDARAHEIRTNLANHAGAIIPLIGDAHSVHEWVHEFHVCTDTTAAGGNAELLAHSV